MDSVGGEQQQKQSRADSVRLRKDEHPAVLNKGILAAEGAARTNELNTVAFASVCEQEK